MKLSVKNLGMGLGLAYASIYLAYIIFMMTATKQTIVNFFNTLMPGFNIGAIMGAKVTMQSAITSIIGIFILGYIFGALIAYFYNMMGKK